ncbi:MAG: DUF2194 domain-containing protein [Bacteroidota bacterium]
MRSLSLVAFLVALLGVAAGASWGADRLGEDAPVTVRPMAPEVLLLVDASDPYALRVAEQARFALARARTPFAEHDVGAGALPRLDAYRAVLTAVERLDALRDPEADRLEAFVEAGGGLGILYRGQSPRLRTLLGLPRRSLAFAPSGDETLVTTAALMPGGEGLRIPTSGLSAYDVPLAPGCEALAMREDAAGEILGPAGWTCPRGVGRVAYWNVALLGTKSFRGYLLQTLALVHPAHVRPASGWAVVFLDDFPAPASNAPLEPIWSQHGQTPAQFYAETWYPDMVGLAERTGLRYTSTVIYAYDGRTRAPFRFAEWLNGRVTVDGEVVPFSPWIAEVDARRSEQALHGFNHQPLLASLWGDAASMGEALRAARQRWRTDDFAPLPTTYVPPMNRIDSVGVAALREVFPEIETLAGLYTGAFENGGDREFGPEPWAPELYALPRTTAGYILTEAERLKMLSVLHTIGAWNHFVHPDEVYANEARERSYRAEGLPSPSDIGWRNGSDGLFPSFERWVETVQTHYPWLDAVTAAEAAERMRAFDALDVAWQDRRDGETRRLEVEASQAGQTFYVWARPDEAVLGVAGGRVVSSWDGPVLTQLVVEADGPRFSITFGPTEA